jgi:hypothetical protein
LADFGGTDELLQTEIKAKVVVEQMELPLAYEQQTLDLNLDTEN